MHQVWWIYAGVAAASYALNPVTTGILQTLKDYAALLLKVFSTRVERTNDGEGKPNA